MQIRPKTKDWLRGLQAQILRRRESLAPASPTANSCLLEEGFDLTSSDYESEGEWPWQAFRSHGEAGRRPCSQGLSGAPPRCGLGMDTGAAVRFAPVMSWAAFSGRIMCQTPTRTGDVETYLKAVVLRMSGLPFGPRPRHEWNSGPVLGVLWAPMAS